ncbi:MAG: ParB N-terminal domain-containing protein [Thermoguttaceae bacterium]|nr:ParB N-terminal domain-containing protein [Thermoguttaceae bacterium]
MRNRVKELRFVKASDLIPNADNWRSHPKRQRDLMKSVLQTIGYADALIVRETEDGSLELIDGHLRADVSPNAEVPALVVDLNAKEAKELLLVHDPIGAMAERDDEAVSRLLADFEATNETLERFIVEEFKLDVDAENDSPPRREKSLSVPTLFQIVVECEDEDDQRACFDELTRSGRKCRVVNL